MIPISFRFPQSYSMQTKVCVFSSPNHISATMRAWNIADTLWSNLVLYIIHTSYEWIWKSMPNKIMSIWISATPWICHCVLETSAGRLSLQSHTIFWLLIWTDWNVSPSWSLRLLVSATHNFNGLRHSPNHVVLLQMLCKGQIYVVFTEFWFDLLGLMFQEIAWTILS